MVVEHLFDGAGLGDAVLAVDGDFQPRFGERLLFRLGAGGVPAVAGLGPGQVLRREVGVRPVEAALFAEVFLSGYFGLLTAVLAGAVASGPGYSECRHCQYLRRGAALIP